MDRHRRSYCTADHIGWSFYITFRVPPDHFTSHSVSLPIILHHIPCPSRSFYITFRVPPPDHFTSHFMSLPIILHHISCPSRSFYITFSVFPHHFIFYFHCAEQPFYNKAFPHLSDYNEMIGNLSSYETHSCFDLIAR